MDDLKVSCIMIARNLLVQGYPFVEAIQSVMPYCSEMIISEGFSTDGTYEVLQRLVKIFNDKMIIYRKKWEGGRNMGEAFAREFNEIKTKCSGDYILRLDPDHIFDTETVKELLLVAKAYPKVDMFYLPYITFVGDWVYKYTWAKNFFKNKSYFKAKSDSGDWSFSRRGVLALATKYLAHPTDFLKVISGGMASFRSYIYTTRPVYHYHAIFPGNYIERIKKHEEFYKRYDWKNYNKALRRLQAIEDWSEFWKVAVTEIYNKQEYYKRTYAICERYAGYPPHPKIVEPLWGLWEYSPREELLSTRSYSKI